MNLSPFFSVLLPTKGRPELARDALLSVLGQTFIDFEVIVSNNGADSATRAALGSLVHDSRVRYLEQEQILPMPEHWEKLSRLAKGHYLTVLPDRSVLKQGALAKIACLHQAGGADAEVITWPWDLYYESGFLLPFAQTTDASVVLESVKLCIDCFRPQAPYPMALPRGLNSSVSANVIRSIRNRHGEAFAPISPDFSFAFNCLLNHPRVVHLEESQMISQGLNVSNGGNAYLTDANAYVSSLGLGQVIKHSPISSLFVENIIAEIVL